MSEGSGVRSSAGRAQAAVVRRGARGVRHDGRGRAADAVSRVGDALWGLGLTLTALVLGIVALVVVCSSVWLMTGRDGNLTQSMSVFTLASPGSWPVLLSGVAGAVVVAALCWLAWRHGRVLDAPRAIAALVACALVLQLLMVLATSTVNTLWGDSWMIRDFVKKAAARGIPAAFEGPYRTIYYDARLYFSCYPFQATFFYLQLFLWKTFGSGAYVVLQAMNSVANCVSCACVLLMGRELTSAVGPRRVLFVLVALCLPLWWLAMFLYNNALGMGLAFLFLWLQVRALRGEGALRVGLVALSALPLAGALCLKSTFVLFAIAAALCWLVVALRERRPAALVTLLCVMLVANGVSKLPASALERDAEYDFGDPMTNLNHLELGLRLGRGEFYVSVDGGEATVAPGGWSDHATSVWAQSGEDAARQNELARKNIASDLKAFAKDPAYGLWFFTTKLATEWADPTYQALYYLSQCQTAEGKPNPADVTTPLGFASTVATFVLDGYQTVTFVAAAGWVALSARSRRRNPVALLLCATFFTGFGCYLLWEAKAVYVFPFALASLPLAAMGIARAFATLARRLDGPAAAGPDAGLDVGADDGVSGARGFVPGAGGTLPGK